MMTEFVARPEELKALKAFGYKVSDTEPFKYEYD